MQLSLSCGSYDRTLPILTGLVKPEGIELTLPPLDLTAGMGTAAAGTYDVYEMPLVTFIIQWAHGDGETLRALPIFPKRTFFHSLVLVRQDSPLRSLADLAGARMGHINWYQHAMGVWLRGHLRERFGILPEQIEWVTERAMTYPMPDPANPSITLVPQGASLPALLAAGRLDAVVHERAHAYLREYPTLRRLLVDSIQAETDYFAETGCFPINHVLVMRAERAEREPWIGDSLLAAFTAAKEMALAGFERNSSIVSSPWQDHMVELTQARLGPDPYPYGLEANRAPLERLVRYLHEQQFIPELLPLEPMFVPEP